MVAFGRRSRYRRALGCFHALALSPRRSRRWGFRSIRECRESASPPGIPAAIADAAPGLDLDTWFARRALGRLRAVRCGIWRAIGVISPRPPPPWHGRMGAIRPSGDGKL